MRTSETELIDSTYIVTPTSTGGPVTYYLIWKKPTYTQEKKTENQNECENWKDVSFWCVQCGEFAEFL